MLRFVADYRSQRVVDGRVRVFDTETVCFTSKYSIMCTFPFNKV